MPFPDSPRCIYDSNPLAEVICQLRFPLILKISNQAPVGFQEAMRNRKSGRTYPNYSAEPGGALPSEVRQLMPPAFAAQLPIVHAFSDTEMTWTISLSQDFISVSTSKYVRWEEFEAELTFVLSVLQSEYRPAAYSRAGLRYKDVIIPGDLGLSGSSWSSLLRPHILAEMGSGDLQESSFEMLRHQALIKLNDDEGHVLLQHGLATDGNKDCYVIDSDFYAERHITLGDELAILKRFNKKSGKLFRWCITPKLHEAMGPKSPDEHGQQHAKSA